MKVRHVRHEDVDPLKTLLVRNYVSGCTSLCNKILIKESLPFPEVIMNHDGWCALIAASHGKILFIPEAKVFYRQHTLNVTGRARYSFNIKVLIKAPITALIRRELSPGWAIYLLLAVLYQAVELQKHLRGLPCDVPPYLSSYINALQNGGILNAFRVMFSIKVRQPGFIPNLLDFYIISKRSHIKYIKLINELFKGSFITTKQLDMIMKDCVGRKIT